jgi:O-methyltransferase
VSPATFLKRLLRPAYARLFEIYDRRFFAPALARRRRDLDATDPRRMMLAQAMDYARHSVEGDYLEFGVSKGGTFVAAVEYARKSELDAMRFYAFDSFQGLPAPKGLDSRGFQHADFTPGGYACSETDFRGILARARVDPARVTIVAGWYSEVLGAGSGLALPLRRAAVAWIDCDFYESTVPVLEFLTRYVQDGTLLIFDDWFCFRGDPERGEQRAFAEWLARNPWIRATELLRFGWHGTSFILRCSPST